MIKTLLGLLAVFVALGTARADASDTPSVTAWAEADGARSRMFAAGRGPDGVHRLGWQVTLEPGWKTYWRSPGEAGLPPRFDFSGSDNLAAAQVRFPLPDRFRLFGLTTYGYSDDLVLPLAITPEDPTRSVHVKVQADYMICSDICVPLTAAFDLTLPPDQSGADTLAARYQAALDRVPAADSGTRLRIEAAKVRGPAGRQKLAVTVASDRAFDTPSLILEAGPDFGLGAPAFALLGDGRRGRFTLDVTSYEGAGSLAGEEIVVTLSDRAGRAVERRLTVD